MLLLCHGAPPVRPYMAEHLFMENQAYCSSLWFPIQFTLLRERKEKEKQPSTWRDSNPRPLDHEYGAVPLCCNYLPIVNTFLSKFIVGYGYIRQTVTHKLPVTNRESSSLFISNLPKKGNYKSENRRY